MYSTKPHPTSEEEHQAEVAHFNTKLIWPRVKMSDADRSALKTRMYLHPAKKHSPVGFNQ